MKAGEPQPLPTRRIRQRMAEAEASAWNALSRYKFWMFGYHASKWVRLNKLLRDFGEPAAPNPWYLLVSLAMEVKDNPELLEYKTRKEKGYEDELD